MLVRSARSLHRPPFLLRTIPRQGRPSQPLLRLAAGPISSRRRFHLSPLSCKGLQPDSSDPQPPNIETAEGTGHLCKAATISVEEYHEIADEYIEDLLLALEEQAEVAQSGYEVEYSAGVLTVNSPQGTYVLNKQPPNKQIWISSPISGPKRYDWVLTKGEGQNQKEGTEMDVEGDLRGGQWVYLRDGSTLTDLLKKELNVQVNASEDEGP